MAKKVSYLFLTDLFSQFYNWYYCQLIKSPRIIQSISKTFWRLGTYLHRPNLDLFLKFIQNFCFKMKTDYPGTIKVQWHKLCKLVWGYFESKCLCILDDCSMPCACQIEQPLEQRQWGNYGTICEENYRYFVVNLEMFH